MYAGSRKRRRRLQILSNSSTEPLEKVVMESSQLSSDQFKSHKIILSPNKISNSKKDIYIFFHICCINNYAEIVNEIISELVKSGLYDKCKKVFYSLSKLPNKHFKETLKKLTKFELIYMNNDLSDVEYPTLSYIEEFCTTNDCYVLYIHTKGVSTPEDEFRQNWRKRLCQKVIQENDICISMLNEGCDIAGCGWKEVKDQKDVDYCVGKYPHYSGNFWWSNSTYIRKLPSLKTIQQNNTHLKTADFLSYRVQCEFWIGMNKDIKIGVNGELNKEYSNKKYYNDFFKPSESNRI